MVPEPDGHLPSSFSRKNSEKKVGAPAERSVNRNVFGQLSNVTYSIVLFRYFDLRGKNLVGYPAISGIKL
jgi:hypothetical protein